MKKQKGFTLIEILISIAIISVLTGVMLSVLNLGGLRSKSRDGQRVSDLKKIQTALELYYADNRAYPISSNWINATTFLKDGTGNAKFVEGNYLTVVPQDPSRTGSIASCCTALAAYGYRSIDGGAYILTAQMEIQESAFPSKCSVLNKAGDYGCSACDSATPEKPFCYGVASPF